ncbi:MAG TPA: NF038122 family metalloprotease, partial [Blastocatellia bacterium]|nr:NF038122 family metalloprotease [Blastocatellia bacterium]
MRNAPIRAVAFVCLFILPMTLFPQSRKADDSTASVLSDNHANWTGPIALGAFVRKIIDGRVVCLEASAAQARSIKERDLTMSRLTPDSDKTGLKIIIRGTSQLQGFPLAIEAFRRAAFQWENLVRTPITVVIDVDFGPTLFGRQFDEKIVSSTDAQVLGGNALYPAIRAGLISEASSSAKTALYNSLPAKAAPTDIGSSAGMTASSATLRSLGVIKESANPDIESSNFGLPPAIGLNSKFDFDFDSGDGVDANKLDFESIALHEIGHVLGFISFVGQQEMDSSIDPELSIWDLFRLRPGDAQKDFAATERVLSSGGDQSFYDGSGLLALSTGRPDGAGGDGAQASHWKDDRLTGQYTGVMDPTLELGEHQFITDNDVDVLYTIGYRTRSVIDQTLLIPLVSGRPQAGGMVAPPLGLGVLSHTHYSIAVPSGATQL